jgi:hypothetical protein
VRHHRSGKTSTVSQATVSFIVLLGLAVPFIPFPTDHLTRIAVRFQTGDMTQPSSFTVRTHHAICAVMSSLMSYEDPQTGEFTRIDCGEDAEAIAPQIRAERLAKPAGN